jgi:hypothetical protein
MDYVMKLYLCDLVWLDPEEKLTLVDGFRNNCGHPNSNFPSFPLLTTLEMARRRKKKNISNADVISNQQCDWRKKNIRSTIKEKFENSASTRSKL